MSGKILIFCSDGISLEKGFLTGGGLRSKQLIDGLGSNFDCVAVEPNSARNRLHEIGYDVTVESQLQFVEKHNPDFVYFLNASAAVSAQQGLLNKPFGLDLHGPIHIESSLINGSSATNEISILRKATERASLISVANDRQRYGLLYGAFLREEYLQEAHRVITIPVYFPNDLLKYVPQDKCSFIYSVGSIYPWQDPVKPLLSLLKVLNQESKLRVVGGPHADLSNEHEIKTFLRDLSLHPKAEVFDQVSRLALDAHLMAASAIVDLSIETSERSLAANTRVAEFLSLGIPVLVDQYSYYGEFLRAMKFDDLVVTNYQDDLKSKVDRLLERSTSQLNELRRKIHKSFHSQSMFKELDENLASAISKV